MSAATLPGAAGNEAITAIVLACDEARHLPDCLASLAWADALIVVDSGSRDGSPALAAAAGATVIDHPFENYSRQRNFALGLAATPWLLFVDADERVSPELAAEIRRAVASGRAEGFWLPRRNVFWGHEMRGGGWWPDLQLRLLRAAAAHYDPARAVHEVAQVSGATAVLECPLLHLNYDHAAEMRAKQRAYARLEADRRRAEGWRWRRRQLLTMPAREGWRRYVKLGGWRDGVTGLVACGLMAWAEWLTLRLLAEDARPAGGDERG